MTIECFCFQKNGSRPVQGAVITVYASGGESLSRTTDFTGRCVFRISRRGVYRVEQTSAPAHLIKSFTVHRIVFLPDMPDDFSVQAGFANALKFAPGSAGRCRAVEAIAAARRAALHPRRHTPFFIDNP